MFHGARSARFAFGVGALAVGVGACGAKRALKKPSAECRAAETVLDRAIALRDFARARALRPATYRACGDRPELRARDRRIVDGEAGVEAARAASARQRDELTAVITAFLAFVASEHTAPNRASSSPHCDPSPPDAAARSMDSGRLAARFCTATRELGRGHAVEIRYDAADPRAFRFSTQLDGPVVCRDLDATATRTWQVAAPGGGTSARSRCDLQGTLAGLAAIVSSSTPSSIHVLSPSYVDRDPATRAAFEP